ncbi:hypothetical protein ACVWZV_009208 [Bradyrhizobium sp. GM5.1]
MLDAIFVPVTPLPDREIGVLDRQLREPRGALGSSGGVEFGEFGEENPGRPSVRDHVMHVEHQEIVRCRSLQDMNADQRTVGQVERPIGEIGEAHPDASFRIGADAGFEGEFRCKPVNDPLHRRAVRKTEGSSPDFVTAYDLFDREAQAAEVKVAAQPCAFRHVIHGRALENLFDKPDALLREGLRHQGSSLGVPDRVTALAGSCGAKVVADTPQPLRRQLICRLACRFARGVRGFHRSESSVP